MTPSPRPKPLNAYREAAAAVVRAAPPLSKATRRRLYDVAARVPRQAALGRSA